ncbi:hypothetical protein TYRP_021295 [Tyrophagus putrescentiae]|nr:hypothetical protein TYRP_021295 [Tyrophagus putrescentiae]
MHRFISGAIERSFPEVNEGEAMLRILKFLAKVLDHHLLNEVDVGDGQHRVEAKVDPVDGAVLLPQANLGHFRSIAENGEEVAHAEEGRPGAGDAPVAPLH